MDMKKGATNVCVSCGRLFFDYSMSVLNYSQILNQKSNDITVEFTKNACPLIFHSNVPAREDDDINIQNIRDDEIGLVCSNCKLYLKKGKVPPLSLSHEELRFPEIPNSRTEQA